jgi:recombination protein RecA
MTEQDRQRAIRLRLARMDEPSAIPVIATGFAALDAALGTGGFPRGQMVELFGASSTGKTTLALQVIAHAQSCGLTAAWIDAEHAFDPAYAATLGVAIDRLPVAKPESAEQALEMVRQLASSRAVDMLVVDSAAALIPRLELETLLGEGGQGLQSRVLASGLRNLAGIVARTGAVVVFLNQLRSRPEASRGESETTAGGPALKLYAAVRISLDARAPDRVRFRVLKNKAAAAFGEGDLHYQRGQGFMKSP